MLGVLTLSCRASFVLSPVKQIKSPANKVIAMK